MKPDVEQQRGVSRLETLEWLEADGLGGFACGTASGLRTRRYHGLLAAATTPPTGRRLLVADLEVEVDLGEGPRALSAHRYAPDTIHPDGLSRLVSFESAPVPCWTFRVDGVRVRQRFAVLRGRPAAVVSWQLEGPRPGARLRVRPLLALRDIHDLRSREAASATDLEVAGDAAGGVCLRWRPDPALPPVCVLGASSYRHEPLVYRDFLYAEERARGYGFTEDLTSPGSFELDLSSGEAGLLLAADGAPSPGGTGRVTALLEQEIQRRAQLPSDLDRAAEAYLVRRGDGHSLIAGYPWFADWGRDTFIALRGLCLARGRLDEAASILCAWAGLVSEGMLPNRFVDAGEAPEFNSVDAALWFAVAVGELLEARDVAGRPATARERRLLEGAVAAILTGYARGTRFGIRMDDDGLLAAGEPGTQLTWMDARADGREVTPRVGKPVEVQALWAAALRVGARFDSRWRRAEERVAATFPDRFWNAERGHLRDVVDVDHVRGTVDDTLRPNQILALGGLPRPLLDNGRARRVVDIVEERLWTPLGLRTLPVDHPDYVGVYAGDPGARDRAYHQGTVWPWLLGPFVEAWVRVRGGDPGTRAEARARFVAPLLEHLGEAGLGHVSEIADGAQPHTPRGAPFQAWSLGELLRLERGVLAATDQAVPRRAPLPAVVPGAKGLA